jgi:hypothetical protein
LTNEPGSDPLCRPPTEKAFFGRADPEWTSRSLPQQATNAPRQGAFYFWSFPWLLCSHRARSAVSRPHSRPGCGVLMCMAVQRCDNGCVAAWQASCGSVKCDCLTRRRRSMGRPSPGAPLQARRRRSSRRPLRGWRRGEPRASGPQGAAPPQPPMRPMAATALAVAACYRLPRERAWCRKRRQERAQPQLQGRARRWTTGASPTSESTCSGAARAYTRVYAPSQAHATLMSNVVSRMKHFRSLIVRASSLRGERLPERAACNPAPPVHPPPPPPRRREAAPFRLPRCAQRGRRATYM